MASSALLNTLCMVCHTNEPKYTCPRCQHRTCSLKCYKRHQTWAQCNGKRDPTVYVKKSQLATPAGIDHDFNFLTGIETAFDVAERGARQRGIVLTNSRTRGPVAGSNFERNLERARVIVERAPKGMSRQKNNQTKWSFKHKCIVWTVEWISVDGSKTLGICREDWPLHKAYKEHLRQQPNPKKRKLDPINQHTAEDDAPSADLIKLQDDSLVGQAQNGGMPIAQVLPTTTWIGGSTSADLQFYLVKPRTYGPSSVLIPLSRDDRLSTCLANQTILEFPTVQVLSVLPNNLPPDFILEDDYYRAHKTRIDQLVEDLGSVETQSLDSEPKVPTQSAVEEGEAVDEEKILQVLQNDIDLVRQFAE